MISNIMRCNNRAQHLATVWHYRAVASQVKKLPSRSCDWTRFVGHRRGKAFSPTPRKKTNFERMCIVPRQLNRTSGTCRLTSLTSRVQCVSPRSENIYHVERGAAETTEVSKMSRSKVGCCTKYCCMIVYKLRSKGSSHPQHDAVHTRGTY